MPTVEITAAVPIAGMLEVARRRMRLAQPLSM
jgi:hypothetical protein